MPFLRAFGSYLPSRVVSNDELAARLNCDSAWIFNVSGISERRYADSESVADMAVHAASDCLARAQMNAADLGMLLVSTGTAERRFPGPAAETAAQLGISGAPALDIPIASAGSLFGLALASELSAARGPILIAASEKMSGAIAADRNTAILFGDGAGACIVHPSAGLAELAQSAIHSDGAFAAALKLEFNQSIEMDGRSVILQASRKVPAAIREVLGQAGLAPDSVSAFLMHQANQNLIVKIAQSLGVAPEKFFSNIARYGNTSSASLLIAAAEWHAQHGFAPGEAVVFAAFGAGFHWGALLARGV